MTAPAPLGPSIINKHIAKRAPSRHDNTVDPYAWLCHVLTELPQRATDAGIEDLLPFNFGERAHQNTS